MAAPVRLTWNLETRAPLESAWAVFADTDRFNRNAGLTFRFDETPQADGSVQRTGSSSKLGLTMKWEEQPFDFTSPEWFRSERRFFGGPVERVVASLALTPCATGTRVRYDVELVPRSMLTWPLVAADARLTVQPQLDRALRAALAHLDTDAPWDPPCPRLRKVAEARVIDLCRTLPTIGVRLAEYLGYAPLARQDRMAPLLLAEAWGIPWDVVVRELLIAVRGGILELRWELLCPSCRGAKASRASLGGGSHPVHCPSCNITYDGSFPDSLAVTFRPHPSIRQFAVQVACILGPMRTPHVLAWQRLEAGASTQWKLDLTAGGYRIDTDGELGGASLEVREGIRAREVAVEVTERGIAPAILRVGPGPVQITLRSRLDRFVRARLDSRALGRHVLTAGRLLELPEVRALLSPEALSAATSARHVCIVAIELLCGAVPGDLGALLKVGTCRAEARRVVIAVDDAGRALELVAAVARDPRYAVAIGAGLVTWLDDAVGGSLVDAVQAAARKVGAGRVVWVSPDDPALLAEVTRREITVRQRDGVTRLVFPKVESPSRPPVLQVGPYVLGDVIGVGGFGRVHAATGPSGEVVVKLLLPEIADDPGQAQRFHNEARLTAAIDHPNTVRVLDWGTADNGQLYLVMERLVGEELDRRIGDGRTLDAAVVAQLGLGLLGGLGAAHAAGVVHRDLKPSNIFLCSTDHARIGPGTVKIIDFGIARSIDDEDVDLAEGVALGTPRYMSPEQVQGEVIDGRTDLYAVGLVLYEALAGDIPFQAPNAMGLAFKRVAEDPTPVRDVATQEVPHALAAVVMRALAREVEDRWPDAATMRAALESTQGV